MMRKSLTLPDGTTIPEATMAECMSVIRDWLGSGKDELRTLDEALFSVSERVIRVVYRDRP